MASTLLLLCLSVMGFLTNTNSEILLLPLNHSLSQSEYNNSHHLLKSTSSRSAARFRRRSQVSLPLSPGSDYTLSLTLHSTPPQSVSLYMDTGSDLVWFPCSPFECILCDQTTPPPNLPLAAASVSCSSPSCAAAHGSHSSSDLCAIAQCPLESIETSDCASFSCPPFYYAYADGSLVARLHNHTLSIPTSSSPNSLFLPNFTFACAHTALAEPIGVAGFGRGLLSMPAQLSALSPHLGNYFSYCLVSHSFDATQVRRPSPLILGRYDRKEKEEDFVYTTMLDNPKHPYLYSVGLLGISVGKRIVPAPEFLKRVDRKGNGGMVVDSGTTFTMLPDGFYKSLVAEFDRHVGRVNKRASKIEDKTGLSPCYYYDNDKPMDVPSLTLHFGGSNTSGVVLPRNNYLYEFLDGRKKTNVGCLMLLNAGYEDELSGGPGATLGNYQQQGFEVVYDLENRRVGFAKRHCSSLWDTLNQR